MAGGTRPPPQEPAQGKDDGERHLEEGERKNEENKARDDDLVGLGHFDGEGEDQVEDDDERGEGVALVPELAF